MKNNNHQTPNDLDTLQEGVSNKTIVKIVDEADLMLQLINSPEERVKAKGSDKTLDRNIEIKLLSGKTVNPQQEYTLFIKFLEKEFQKYERRVPQIYYKEIFRLNSWAIPEGNIKEKPSIVGQYTNQIIYARFDKSILAELRRKNPYINLGRREFKHFQLLTQHGLDNFDQYIQDAIICMLECTDWYEFSKKYAIKYGLAFQLNMQRENRLSTNSHEIINYYSK